MSTTFAVSLDGELFHATIKTEDPEREGPHTYYVLEILHVSSGMAFDTSVDSDEPKDVMASYGFAEDLASFYRRLFGRSAEATTFAEEASPDEMVRCVCGYGPAPRSDLDQHIGASVSSPEDHAERHF